MSFTEKTAAEAGFKDQWDRYIEPGIAYHKQNYRRFVALEIIAGLLACLIGFVVGYLVLEWGSQTDNVWLSVALIVVIALACFGVAHWAGRPLRRLTGMASHQLQLALAAHFVGWIKPTDDAAAMQKYAKYLQKQNMTTRGSIKIGTAYDSIASQPAFRFYNCTYTKPGTNGSSGTDTTYLMVHIRMARALSSPVKILVDRGIGNVVSKIMARRNNIAFSNAEFERQYEVFAEDEALARQIVTDEFQQSMLDLYNYFSADMSWFMESSKISCILEGNELVVCISEINDVDGSKTAKGSTKELEKAAHQAIAEIGQIPYIVKTMQMAMPGLFTTPKH